MSTEQWQVAKPAMKTALIGIAAPGRNVSVATKMMHLKRPKLFPVLDALVVQSIGGKYYTGKFPDRRADRSLGFMSTYAVKVSRRERRSRRSRRVLPLSNCRGNHAHPGRSALDDQPAIRARPNRSHHRTLAAGRRNRVGSDPKGPKVIAGPPQRVGRPKNLFR